MARWALTILGLLLIIAGLRDVVQELFFIEDVGTISRLVVNTLWRIQRRIGRHFRGAIAHAGPIMVLSVAITWIALLAFGWAFIYWPRLGDFSAASNIPVAATRHFGTALDISLSAMSTLNAAELSPVAQPARIAVALESFVGPILFTAWISWMLSISPVLAERRSFARQVELLRRAHDDPNDAARETPPESIVDVMRSLTEQLVRIASQVRQSHVTYYFQNDQRPETLVRQLPWTLAFARAALALDGPPALRHRADMLCMAVVELLDLLGNQYLDLEHATPDEILRALAEDHLLEAELPEKRGASAHH